MAMSDKIEWIDRVGIVDKHNKWTGKTPVIEDRMIGALAERYSALERVRYQSGEIRRLLDKLARSHPGEPFGSLSELRATASTMLDNHETYGRYAQHFLGHSPRSVAQSNYVSPSQTQFDKALIWLGEQFGF
jgi:hypothetical protein